MKKLSLFILLLLFAASSVQAISFSPSAWAQQTVKWATDNKKKVVTDLSARGKALFDNCCKAYPRLNTLGEFVPQNPKIIMALALTFAAITPIVVALMKNDSEKDAGDDTVK